MRLCVSVVCCFIAAISAVNGKLQPICEPSSASNSSGPKLPTLPTAFSTLMEINIVNKNYTFAFKELYDQKGDKGRIEFAGHGRRRVAIYDYTLKEIIHVDMNAKNCTVSSTLDRNQGGRFSFFGVGPHIESVSELFKFGKSFNETYVGVSSVRGIRCHHWRACILNNHSSFYLDYYFSVPDWRTSAGMLNSTVVRAVVNGTSLNVHFNRHNHTISVLNSTHDFYHVYDFFDFQPGPPDPSNFQLPEGLYCKGLKGANKTVPKVPPVFSMEFESVGGYRNNNTVFSGQEFYDLEKRLTMFKYPNRWHPSGAPEILIHDFNTGIGYNISGGQYGTSCRLFNLTVREMDATDDGSHHIRMKTTQELFSTPHTNGSSALVYKGSTTVRGISADIWVGKAVWKWKNRTFEMVEEWYFSKPNWRVRSGSLNDERQVPLGLTVYGQGGRSRQVMNFFNFDAEAADPTLFDIKPCFTWEEQRLVRFSLSVQEGKYQKYGGSREFILSLTKTISAVANVSIIRVNGIRVLDYKDEEMVVTFIMLNRTKPMGGDVGVVFSEKGLMDALDALKNSVNSEQFKVPFQKETLKAVKSSFFVGFRPSPPPPPPATTTPSSKPQPGGGGKHKKGVSSGAAAGISILMLVVGIAGGLLIAHLIMKRRGTGLFRYQRQE